MNFIGNILWLVFGGIVIAIIYYLVGLLMCISLIGIPFGVQLFKLGTYALWPFLLHYHRGRPVGTPALQNGHQFSISIRKRDSLICVRAFNEQPRQS